MKEITFEDELKRELKNPDAWMEQIGHTLRLAFNLVGQAIIGTTVLVWFTFLMLVIYGDIGYIPTGPDAVKFLTVMTEFAAMIYTMLSIFLFFIRQRNIFAERAWRSIERQNDLRDGVNLTEAVLEKHQLIPEPEAEK